MTVTAEQVREAMTRENITAVDHHECSICGYMTKYVVGDDGELWFDPGCYCTSGEGWRPSGYQGAADWINIQMNHEIRRKLANRFGIAL